MRLVPGPSADSSCRPNHRSHRFIFRQLTLFSVLLVLLIATTLQWWKVSSAEFGPHLARSGGVSLVPAALAKSSDVVLAPTIGNYPNTTVSSGANATITPDGVPANATHINVATSTNFKGTFAADPATGVVRVTNAHPLGAYTVTVRAFDSGGIDTTTTFTLI